MMGDEAERALWPLYRHYKYNTTVRDIEHQSINNVYSKSTFQHAHRIRRDMTDIAPALHDGNIA
jgi:hypothetical protein